MITIKSGTVSTTVTVVQDSNKTITLSRTSFAPTKAGGTGEATITAYNQDTWTVTSDQPWVATAGPAAATATALTVVVQPNTGPARTATLTIRTTHGHTSIITLTQPAG
jgi:hypothetical protein